MRRSLLLLPVIASLSFAPAARAQAIPPPPAVNDPMLLRISDVDAAVASDS